MYREDTQNTMYSPVRAGRKYKSSGTPAGHPANRFCWMQWEFHLSLTLSSDEAVHTHTPSSEQSEKWTQGLTHEYMWPSLHKPPIHRTLSKLRYLHSQKAYFLPIPVVSWNFDRAFGCEDTRVPIIASSNSAIWETRHWNVLLRIRRRSRRFPRYNATE